MSWKSIKITHKVKRKIKFELLVLVVSAALQYCFFFLQKYLESVRVASVFTCCLPFVRFSSPWLFCACEHGQDSDGKCLTTRDFSNPKKLRERERQLGVHHRPSTSHHHRPVIRSKSLNVNKCRWANLFGSHCNINLVDYRWCVLSSISFCWLWFVLDKSPDVRKKHGAIAMVGISIDTLTWPLKHSATK